MRSDEDPQNMAGECDHGKPGQDHSLIPIGEDGAFTCGMCRRMWVPPSQGEGGYKLAEPNERI